MENRFLNSRFFSKGFGEKMFFFIFAEIWIRMSQDYRLTLQRLHEKASLIAQRYEVAMKQRNEAFSKIEELNKELSKREKELNGLKTEIENLVIVKTAFPSHESIAEGRRYLSGLVKEIDQCINDLTS